MLLMDANVLVYAHRAEVPDHGRYRRWVEDLANGDEAFGLSETVLCGFLRIVTHPKVFTRPTPLGTALAFVEALRAQDNAVVVSPGARHWAIFVDLCRRASSRGNHVPDAFLAALAIESGSEWITTDRGFARFPGLRWRHPLTD